MINLFKLKQEKKDKKEESGETKSSAFLRTQKDHNELDLPKMVSVEFPDADDLMNFVFAISPEEGYYAGSTIKFKVSVGDEYPYKPPKVSCMQKIYHPNCDLSGNVCLSILKDRTVDPDGWSPVLNLGSVALGLVFWLMEPNYSDPLNKDAAKDMKENAERFGRNVRRALQGGSVDGIRFEKCL
eukprot:m.62328 g.62328  ORF g.62328 m.62328 type:complete len:184 (+) comp8026_c0_seq1:246-797(+)